MTITSVPSRIVIGIGDDPAAVAALAYAVAEARRCNAELVAVRAWGPLADPSPRDAVPPGAEAELRARANDEITRAFDEAAGGVPLDVKVKTETPEGPPGRALARVADRADDLIVVGRSRHLLGRRAVFGSVPDYLMDHATCRVLVQTFPRHHRHRDEHHADRPPTGIFY